MGCNYISFIVYMYSSSHACMMSRSSENDDDDDDEIGVLCVCMIYTIAVFFIFWILASLSIL